MGELLKEVNKNSKSFHRNADGSWGTDEHDGKIIGDVIKAIFNGVVEIIKAKK